MNVAARTISLNADGSERVTVDVQQNQYRVAFYRGDQRWAHKGKNLEQILQVLFGEADAKHDERATAEYIRALPGWGVMLPATF